MNSVVDSRPTGNRWTEDLGVTDPSMKKHRAPTVSFTHPSMTAEQIGAKLAEKEFSLGQEFLCSRII